ncbi:hypothetical protein LSAT2_027409, partial [Lamellibrachia satsuma]
AGLNAGGACLFKNASIGCSVLPTDIQYSSECALLKLFKSFDVATEHQLRALRFLPSIVKLQRILLERYERKIDKAEANNLKVSDFLESLQDDHAREEHMTLVNHFGQAWYLLREAIAKVVQDVTRAHLVSYHPERDLLPVVLSCCQYSLHLGKGSAITYDFVTLERQIVDRSRLAEQHRIHNEMCHLTDLTNSLANLDIAIGFLVSVGVCSYECSLLHITVKQDTNAEDYADNQDQQLGYLVDSYLDTTDALSIPVLTNGRFPADILAKHCLDT